MPLFPALAEKRFKIGPLTGHIQPDLELDAIDVVDLETDFEDFELGGAVFFVIFFGGETIFKR